MDPRNYKTWTSFSDHPIFCDPLAVSKWSSKPEVYRNTAYMNEFDPQWYVHQDPRLSREVQNECAVSDLKNLVEVCQEIESCFGTAHHELFILDDLTVYVDLAVGDLALTIYPLHLDPNGNQFLLSIESSHSIEKSMDVDELRVGSVESVLKVLGTVVNQA